jgi:hypothetical protein
LNEKELTQTLLDESAAIYNVINVYPKFLRFTPGQYGSRELDVATRMGFVVTEWNLGAHSPYHLTDAQTPTITRSKGRV